MSYRDPAGHDDPETVVLLPPAFNPPRATPILNALLDGAERFARLGIVGFGFVLPMREFIQLRDELSDFVRGMGLMEHRDDLRIRVMGPFGEFDVEARP